MPHSWKFYYTAEEIAKKLEEAGIIKKEDNVRARGIIQIHLEDIPTLTELLARLDWIKILEHAINSRPSSWNVNPVREWRNASDTIYCALIQALREKGYVR